MNMWHYLWWYEIKAGYSSLREAWRLHSVYGLLMSVVEKQLVDEDEVSSVLLIFPPLHLFCSPSFFSPWWRSTDYSADYNQCFTLLLNNSLLQAEEGTVNNFYLSSTSPPSQQTPPGCYDPADAEPAVVPDQEVPRWAGLPQRRQAPLPEPVREATGKHLLLRRCLLLRQDGPPPQSLGESAGEEDLCCLHWIMT